MTVRDEVLRELRSAPEGLSDGELTTRLHKNHAQINMLCRQLAAEGVVVRDDAFRPIRNRLADGAMAFDPQHTAAVAQVRPPAADGQRDWYWEGRVQAIVVRHLAAEDWSIVRVADTARQERGVDVIAERDGRRLLVEVKGWPATTYTRGERAGQPKPTQPSVQAGHYFSGALVDLLRRRPSDPAADLALALPDMPRYRALLSDVRWALDRLEIIVLLVNAEDTVTTWE